MKIRTISHSSVLDTSNQTFVWRVTCHGVTLSFLLNLEKRTKPSTLKPTTKCGPFIRGKGKPDLTSEDHVQSGCARLLSVSLSRWRDLTNTYCLPCHVISPSCHVIAVTTSHEINLSSDKGRWRLFCSRKGAKVTTLTNCISNMLNNSAVLNWLVTNWGFPRKCVRVPGWKPGCET